jgi:hypothetical protein
VDEWVEYNETGIYALDGFEEAGGVFREGEGTIAGGVRLWNGLLDEREDFDA